MTVHFPSQRTFRVLPCHMLDFAPCSSKVLVKGISSLIIVKGIHTVPRHFRVGDFRGFDFLLSITSKDLSGSPTH